MAVDPGLANFGYAVGKKPNQIIDYGTFRPKRGEDKFKSLQFFIVSLLKEYQPELVIYEQYRIYGREYSYLHKTSEVIGLIKTLCEMHAIACIEVNHNKWKAMFNRVYSACHLKLPLEWKQGLQAKSEHTRDAVMMLLPYVISIKDLLMRENDEKEKV